MPDILTAERVYESSDDEISEKSYNSRARSPTPCATRSKKSKATRTKQGRNGASSGSKRKHGKAKKKKKRIKTSEEYDEEWKKREDSPYPRRHSEFIVGRSASEMMRFNLPISKKSFGFPGSKGKKTSPAKQASTKRKLEAIEEDEELSIHKRLKMVIRMPAGEKRKVHKVTKEGYVEIDSDSSDEDEETDQLANDDLDDPDYCESTETTKGTKKGSRTGKDLGHRQDDDGIAPSTARYLASLRASPVVTGYASSGGLSGQEAAALSAMTSASSTSSHLGSPASYRSHAASSSSSGYVDPRQDAEPGWEIKSRTPLGSRSLSQASSRANTPPPSSSSRRTRPDRPGLRRENSGIHPNAFIVGLPVDFVVGPLQDLLMSTQTATQGMQLTPAGPATEPPAEDLGQSLSSDSSSSSSSGEEEELDTDEDELVLGIISPERPRVASLTDIEEGEGSLLDETWPELEKMPCSPEDVPVPTQADLPDSREGSARDDEADSAVTNEAGHQTSTASTYPPPKQDVQSPCSGSVHSSRRRLIDADDILDDAADKKAEAEGAAAVQKLRESLRRDLATESVLDEDMGFVQRMMEQCDMVVHPSGSTSTYEPPRSLRPLSKMKGKKRDKGITAPPSSPRAE